jgi:hypothetical protein
VGVGFEAAPRPGEGTPFAIPLFHHIIRVKKLNLKLFTSLQVRSVIYGIPNLQLSEDTIKQARAADRTKNPAQRLLQGP